MSSHDVCSDTAAGMTAGGVADDGHWTIRRRGRLEPLEECLRQQVAAYQRQSGGLGLAQGVLSVQASTPAAADAAASACVRLLQSLPVAWSTLRLAPRGAASASTQVLPHLPAAAVLTAAREAGLLPPSRWAAAMPALLLTLWTVVILGAVALMAVEGPAGGAFGPGWRLLAIVVGIAVLALVLRWLRRRREASALRRCGDSLRGAAEPSQLAAFAQALAAPALNALPKPVAIVIQDPSRLDPLSLDILRAMRLGTGATAIGIVHWIVFRLEGADAAAADAIVAGAGGGGNGVPVEPPGVLAWQPLQGGSHA